jgi:hypothetical protein
MDTNRGTEPRRLRSPIRPIEHEAHAGFESKKEDEEMRHRACCVETRSSPDLLGANVRALTFYLGNPFPRFLFSLLKSYAGAIADGDGEQWHYREAFGAHSLRTKRSVMFSSLKS